MYYAYGNDPLTVSVRVIYLFGDYSAGEQVGVYLFISLFDSFGPVFYKKMISCIVVVLRSGYYVS